MAPRQREANRWSCSQKQQQKPSSSALPSHSSYIVKPYQGFSKIIGRSAVELEMMMLPMEFVSKYGRELSDTAIVSVPCGGCSWKLGFTKRSNHSVWFDEGFKEFMRYYSIDYGYNLAFTYKGVSCFKVRIYKANGFEISYSPHEELINGNGDHSNTPLHDHNDDSDCSDSDNDNDDDDDDDDEYEPPPVVLESKRKRGQPCERVAPDPCSYYPHEEQRNGNGGDHSNTPLHHHSGDGDYWNDEDAYEQPHVVVESKRRRGQSSKRKAPSSAPHEMAVIKVEPDDGIMGQHPVMEEEDDDDDDDDDDDESNSEKEDMLLAKRLEEIGMVTNMKFLSTLGSLSPGSKKAVHEAVLMKPKNPSFLVVLKLPNLTHGKLYLPKYFWRTHKELATQRSIRIEPLDIVKAGSGWRINVYKLKHSGMITSTCHYFFRDNRLQAGDVCVFELVSSTEAVFKLSVVHAA